MLKRFASSALLLALALSVAFAAGCKDPYGACVKASSTVATAIAQAYPAIDADRQSGLLTVSQELKFDGFLNVANTLNGQFQTCVSGVHSAKGAAASYAGCAQTFANGVSNASELANLNIVNASEQAKITAIAQSISTGLQALITSLGSGN